MTFDLEILIEKHEHMPDGGHALTVHITKLLVRRGNSVGGIVPSPVWAVIRSVCRQLCFVMKESHATAVA